jgi:hypothetical protein
MPEEETEWWQCVETPFSYTCRQFPDPEPRPGRLGPGGGKDARPGEAGIHPGPSPGGDGSGAGGSHGSGSSTDPIFDISGLKEMEALKFLSTVSTLEENCFYSAMINTLNTNPLVEINSLQNSSGGYSATSNTIKFKNEQSIKPLTVAPEIFHAYQQQYTGRLDDAQVSSDRRGMSNFEFEKKFMNIVAGYIEIFQNPVPNFSPLGDFPGFEGVND